MIVCCDALILILRTLRTFNPLTASALWGFFADGGGVGRLAAIGVTLFSE